MKLDDKITNEKRLQTRHRDDLVMAEDYNKLCDNLRSQSEYQKIVYGIDDSFQMREIFEHLFGSVRISMRFYNTVRDFLLEYKDNLESSEKFAECLLLDVRMPDMTGIELQESLLKEDHKIPVIFVTAFGDVESAVRAMKNGAIDYLIKPINSQLLLESINIAFSIDIKRKMNLERYKDLYNKVKRLTHREYEILVEFVKGNPNIEIADKFGIASKTVELHKSSIMKKLSQKSGAELMRVLFVSGLIEKLL